MYSKEIETMYDQLIELGVHKDVLAYAYLEGYVEWNGEVNWASIEEMVWQDTYSALKDKLEE